MQCLYNICHYYELHCWLLNTRKELNILSRIPCEDQGPLQIVAYIVDVNNKFGRSCYGYKIVMINL